LKGFDFKLLGGWFAQIFESPSHRRKSTCFYIAGLAPVYRPWSVHSWTSKAADTTTRHAFEPALPLIIQDNLALGKTAEGRDAYARIGSNHIPRYDHGSVHVHVQLHMAKPWLEYSIEDVHGGLYLWWVW